MAKEKQLIAHIRKWVEAQGGKVYHYPGGSPYATEGFPDLIIVLPWLTCFVEAKAKGKKPEVHQIARMDEMRDAGAAVFWVDNLESFINTVNK